MRPEAGQSASIWMAVAVPVRSPLASESRADVCVIGAGIAGLTTAYLLARAGQRVIVIEDGAIAGGETGRTTAHLVDALDDRYFELERLHGEGGARLAAESHRAAIGRIERLVAQESIECDFQRLDGWLCSPPGESADTLRRELAAAHRAGLTEVEFVERLPYDGFEFGPALRFPRQAQVHPLAYMTGLLRAAERAGATVHGATHASAIEDGAPVVVQTEGGPSVTADSVVVATNAPVHTLVALHTKQAPYRTYVVAGRVSSGSVPRMLLWDTADPYHYLRLRAERGAEEMLIVGGEDHKTGQADDAERRWARLEAWTRERFPSFGPVEHRWSGQVMEPIDGLAFIGRSPGSEHVFVATGDSGNGMTHGTIAGMLLRDLILGRDNPWAALYEPARKSLRAAGPFVKENVNVAAQYADWVTGGEVNSVDEIAPGSGAVLRRGLGKIAAYRDASGNLVEFSARCPHLGCVVAWNHAERTWDCPCHGSRFAADGHVLNGPAISGLAPADD